MPLSEEENQTLTRVGPGTPMGDLLRRYWQPIAAVGELEDQPVKAIRIFGEDLVLYRDLSGTYGLIERACAHRLTDLAFGICEEIGLRCPRHGWLYNETGLCLDQPLEEEPMQEEIRLRAYPVQIKAGLIWAYLGPQPAPLVPEWEPFEWEDGFIQIVFAPLACNWLQCQENALDPIEIEWFHAGLKQSEQDQLPPPPALDLAMDFDEFEFGFVYRRGARQGDENPAEMSVGRTAIWPNALFSGDPRSCHFEWRVPVDDTNTMIVAWFVDRVPPGVELPVEKRIVHWYAPLKDEDNGEWITTHAMNRSFVIWSHQEPIVDRTREILSATDEGVVLLRNKLFAQIRLIADGGEPKAVIRDPAQNVRLLLPFTQGTERPAGEEPPRPAEFPFLAGQPPEVAEAYRRVLETWDRSS
jgi:5,5'-dehydrodivanillate O-demethylase